MYPDEKPKRTDTYLAAEKSLPKELHELFEQMVAEYQFACLKHHRQRFASPKVIAELIRMGWRSTPISNVGQEKA
jgi:hypothetical protein